MKKTAKIMAIISLTLTVAVGFVMTNQTATTKAETTAEETYTTYDTNGNAVQITYSQITSMSSSGGNIRYIVCPELDTKVYFNTDGSVKKIVQYSTGETLFDYTTASASEETTAEAVTIVYDYEEAEVKTYTVSEYKKATAKKKVKYFTKKKVKGVKVKKKKERKGSDKVVGYNISWKKMKKATGYQVKVYVYSPLNKKYVCIKTKNTKKRKYVLTNIENNCKYKITVQAYKGSGINKKYSKVSKQKKIKVNEEYSNCITWITKYKKLSKLNEKNYVARITSEKAFILQNKERVKAGVGKLEWSETLFGIAYIRCVDMATVSGLSHDNLYKNAKEYYINQYSAESSDFKYNSMTKTDGIFLAYINLGENCLNFYNTSSSIIYAWKTEPQHYENMIHESYEAGAMCQVSSYMSSLFSSIENYDESLADVLANR